ncbi:MAG TPA: adenosylmethionine decarboxylase [Elainellaceae cyanobacterium]
MLHLPSGQLGDRPLAPVGLHCILELYGCPATRLNDTALIRDLLKGSADRARSTFLGDLIHQFSPHGITALALLAESHISIHTWPEEGYAAIDVFTCGEHTQPEQACHYLIEQLEARHHSLCVLPRKTHQPIHIKTFER